MSPLPADGPRRSIFIAALQDYRNSCHPPELTPGCPFFTWTANGPACGEECADLLAEYGDPNEEGRVDLGGGIVIYRQRSNRRPRRGPGSSDKPFDARELYLNDENRPHADRRTPALFIELTDLICAVPATWDDPHERDYDIGAVQEQLANRGFDTEALIRYGLGQQLAVHIVLQMVLSMATRGDSPLAELPSAKHVTDTPPLGDEWVEFFNDALKADNPDTTGDLEAVAYFLLHGFLDRIIAWVGTAEMEEIISWSPPTLATSEPTSDDEDTRQRRERALWMAERFSVPYEKDWMLSSLHLEWLYLHGRVPAPCSPTAMAERKTSAQVISNEIARLSSSDWDRAHAQASNRSVSADDFVRVAVGHVQNGRPELAAAIFEALIRISPNDGDAHNNYGFCVLPQDPAAALESLTKATRLQRGNSLTTLANIVLALHLVGKDKEALALGLSETAANLPAIQGWMWVCGEDHKLQLTDLTDVRSYLEDLVRHIEGACPEIPAILED